METRKIIENKVKEGIEKHNRKHVVVGFMNKCANSLYDSYRYLEEALQYCDDDEVRKTLEDIKMNMGHEVGISGDFEEIPAGIISKLQKILGKFKPY